jgi:hypothetical protein
MTMNSRTAKEARLGPLDTPTDLAPNGVAEISGALTTLLADMFALYVKTKNFHWHVTCWTFRWPAHMSKRVATTEEIPMFNRETESQSGFLRDDSTSVAQRQDAGSSSPRSHRHNVLSSVSASSCAR